jgi:hypothetical protein
MIDRTIRNFWVDLGYGTCYMGAKDGVVVDAAPLISWMNGKTLEEIRPWLIKKKAVVKEFWI